MKLLGSSYKRWTFQKIKIPRFQIQESKYVKTKCKQWTSKFKNQHVKQWNGEGYYKKQQSTMKIQDAKAYKSHTN
jgi:hypothetical protein